MTDHNPAIRCEMFCDKPIGPDGDPGEDDWKACCPSCREALDFVCREVMPAVRRNGYYAPPGASVDGEFAAMQQQVDFRPVAADLLSHVLGPEMATALGWGPREDGETT